ncbi:hypothetical protein BN2537_12173 [Streptomyces venezuelae]|nr:hypothetical protein BN2537_12173 [Streptomyces venezuelae]
MKDLETLGYAIAALVWGGVALALLACGVATVLAVRWRRCAIAALESEEAAVEAAPGRADISS